MKQIVIIMVKIINTIIAIACLFAGLIGISFTVTPFFSLLLIILSLGLFLEGNKELMRSIITKYFGQTIGNTFHFLRFFIFFVFGLGIAYLVSVSGIEILLTTPFFMLLLIIGLFFSNRVYIEDSKNC